MSELIGQSTSQGTPGVLGKNTADGDAVFGQASSGGRGVVGVSDNHTGVEGDSARGTGVWGSSTFGPGVHGISTSGRGVEGLSTNDHGVFGQSTNDVGVLGQAPRGVVGISTSGNGTEGQSSSATGKGVFGENTAGGDGVFGIGNNGGRGIVGVSDSHTGVECNSDTGTGVWATSTSGTAVYGKGGLFAGYFEGDVSVTGDLFLQGADCAEEFDVAEAAAIGPGTVVVLGQDGTLQQCQQPYDKKVAGVISGAGNYRPGMILDRHQSQENRMPVALVGKVFCKVDARYAPIEIGDMLTTSPTPGHAMKVGDPLKAFGSVMGKALRPLRDGQDLIPILITLQ